MKYSKRIKIKSVNISEENVKSIFDIFEKNRLDFEISLKFKNGEALSSKKDEIDLNSIYISNRRIDSFIVNTPFPNENSVSFVLSSSNILTSNSAEILFSLNNESDFNNVHSNITEFLKSLNKSNIFCRFFNSWYRLWLVFTIVAITEIYFFKLIGVTFNNFGFVIFLYIIIGFLATFILFIQFPNVTFTFGKNKFIRILNSIAGTIGTIFIGLIIALIVKSIVG